MTWTEAEVELHGGVRLRRGRARLWVEAVRGGGDVPGTVGAVRAERDVGQGVGATGIGRGRAAEFAADEGARERLIGIQIGDVCPGSSRNRRSGQSEVEQDRGAAEDRNGLGLRLEACSRGGDEDLARASSGCPQRPVRARSCPEHRYERRRPNLQEGALDRLAGRGADHAADDRRPVADLDQVDVGDRRLVEPRPGPRGWVRSSSPSQRALMKERWVATLPRARSNGPST